MRGKSKAQPEFCALINLNERVPVDHPLRGIRQRVDVVLKKLSGEFDQLYAEEGRPSIPPEQLIKSRILMALYSVRRSRYRGVERTQAWVYLVASSYNLLRMAKLGLAAPTNRAPYCERD